MKQLIKGILVIFFTTFFLQLSRGQGPAQIEYDIPNLVTSKDLISLPRYKVEIYKGSKDDIFYIGPFIIPDWDFYKQQLDSIKIKDQIDNKTLYIKLQINFITEDIQNEILGIILSNGLAKSPNPSINFLPFSYYVISANFSDDGGKSYSFILNPETFEHIGQTVKPSLSIPPYIANIKGNYKMLLALYNARTISNTLSGKSFSSGYLYSANNLTAVSKILSNQNIIQNIKGTEDVKLKTILSNGSSSGGIGLSLGPISLGGSEQNSTTTTEISNSRYVNRNYIGNSIQAHKSEIDILAQGDAEFIKNSIATVVDMFSKNMQSVNVRFDKRNESEYQVTIENAGRYDLTGEQAKSLLSAKPTSDITTEKDNSNITGEKSRTVQKGDIKIANDISWTFDGKNYIPTSGTFYVASNTNLQDQLTVKLGSYVKSGTVGMAVDMIYPNAVYLTNIKSKVAEKLGFPVGTIVAFGGELSKIPSGWRLCDGTYLSIHDNQSLYNAIGYNWGKQDNGNFQLPDLRGAFIRGLDPTAKLDPDGATRTVGSLQNEAFLNHTHTPPEGLKYFITQGSGGDLYGAPGAVGVPAETGKSKTGGNETRPDNYAVNFIIKCV